VDIKGEKLWLVHWGHVMISLFFLRGTLSLDLMGLTCIFSPADLGNLKSHSKSIKHGVSQK